MEFTYFYQNFIVLLGAINIAKKIDIHHFFIYTEIIYIFETEMPTNPRIEDQNVEFTIQFFTFLHKISILTDGFEYIELILLAI